MKMLHNYFHIGEVAADLLYGWIDKCFDFCNYIFMFARLSKEM
jgi:NAD(P)H-quinone oxidoreductase subunit H